LRSDVHVLVVGAGFGGIGLAIRLRQAGIQDVLVVERSGAIGGTWRDNDYPGCTCDIPSTLYSFSFAPNPGWTSSFPKQAEILRYLHECVRRWGLSDQLALDTELLAATWDDGARRWLVETSRGTVTARFLVAATGPFDQPVVPALPGLENFTGTAFHSARWDHAHDLTARRVAVVGTGASAVQVVPAVAAVASSVLVYQSSPPWVMPKKVRPVGALRRGLYRRVPAAQRLVRGVQYWSRELPALAAGGNRVLLSALEAQGRAHLRAQVPDPELRRRLTPDYRIFCKRVLLSDDYYPTLTRPHVELVDAPVTGVTEDGIVAADGTVRQTDTIIFATGFAVTEPPITHRLYGRSGDSLAATWRAHGRAAYLGTTVSGFPNLFVLTGPHAGTSHTSLLVMIEAQTDYTVACLRTAIATGIEVVEVRPEVQRRFMDEAGEATRHTVSVTGGCRSYYLDADGGNTTLWPGSTWRFRRRTRRFDSDSYQLLRQGADRRPAGMERT
jgi:cation diffusion facilitator CzcD-associated flavoprotein CzcO